MEIRLNYENVSFQGNGKLKLLIIVGTRPEIIRLSAVINKCRQYFDCLLAHTGQNYDYNLNGVFFKDLKLAPYSKVKFYMKGQSSWISFKKTVDEGEILYLDNKDTHILCDGSWNEILIEKIENGYTFYIVLANNCSKLVGVIYAVKLGAAYKRNVVVDKIIVEISVSKCTTVCSYQKICTIKIWCINRQ